MNAHPVDGEELQLLQLTVGKHLVAQVADLDIETAPRQLAAQPVDHHPEQLALGVSLVCRVVDALA